MNIFESLSSCFWFSPENKRNTFASILAGVLVNILIIIIQIIKHYNQMSHNHKKKNVK